MNWQPIETAPKDGRCDKVLLYDCQCEIGHWDGRWIGLDGYRLEPTHWMPLPEPPTQENAK